MKTEVEFETYRCLMGFKRQQTIITLQDCSVITLNYSPTTLEVIVEGNDSQHIDDIIYGIWELCCFFDGYFYKPIKYVVNNRVELPETLIRLDLYKTDEKWIENGLKLRKDDFMPLNKEIIEKYIRIRHNRTTAFGQEMLESKMTLQLINSFFYIFSTAYSGILIDHRLSLLLNICDGYAINEGKNQSTKDNITSVLTIDNIKEVKVFVNNRYGVSIGNFNDMIYGTRNELDHFDFDKKSARNAILLNRADNSFYLFLVYLFRTAFRATFLRKLCTDESAIAEIDKAQKEAMNKIMKWSEEVK